MCCYATCRRPCRRLDPACRCRSGIPARRSRSRAGGSTRPPLSGGSTSKPSASRCSSHSCRAGERDVAVAAVEEGAVSQHPEVDVDGRRRCRPWACCPSRGRRCRRTSDRRRSSDHAAHGVVSCPPIRNWCADDQVVVGERAGADRRVDPARCCVGEEPTSRRRTTCPSGSATSGTAMSSGAPQDVDAGRSHTSATTSLGGRVWPRLTPWSSTRRRAR